MSESAFEVDNLKELKDSDHNGGVKVGLDESQTAFEGGESAVDAFELAFEEPKEDSKKIYFEANLTEEMEKANKLDLEILDDETIMFSLTDKNGNKRYSQEIALPGPISIDKPISLEKLSSRHLKIVFLKKRVETTAETQG